MTPLKALITIISLFLVLGLMALIYPTTGINISETTTLRFPSLADVFPTADTTLGGKVDPEEEFKAMMEATRKKQFAAFADSLRYYEDFFESGKTRFDLPNNDATWFDRFFLHLQLSTIDSSVVHIVHYGDSQLEEDRISSTLREDLQEEFGGSGPGLLPPILNVPSQTTSHWNSGDLERFILFGPKDEEATHNRYGPLAQFANINGSAVIGIKRREDRKNTFPHVGGYSTIKVLAGKRGKLKLKLSFAQTFIDTIGINPDSTVKEKRKMKTVDAGEPVIDSSYNKLNVYTWKLPDTTSSIKLHLSGNAEIYGLAADGKNGVAVDNVAMRGSSGTIFHRIDPELLAESYKAINAKLIIMEYGGNMVPSINSSSIEWTKKLITRQIQAIQTANPNADILFIGPADMAKQVDGKWRTYPALNMTIKALRQVALENGAAYWDMHRVMGGDGAMMKWVRQSPPLGFTDHIHFTRRGAAHMGDLFCSSMRMYYEYFKFRDRHSLTDQELKAIHGISDTSATAVAAADSTILDKKAAVQAAAKAEAAKVAAKAEAAKQEAAAQEQKAPEKEVKVPEKKPVEVAKKADTVQTKKVVQNVEKPKKAEPEQKKEKVQMKYASADTTMTRVRFKNPKTKAVPTYYRKYSSSSSAQDVAMSSAQEEKKSSYTTYGQSEKKSTYKQSEKKTTYGQSDKSTYGQGDKKNTYGKDEKKSTYTYGQGDKKSTYSKDEKKPTKKKAKKKKRKKGAKKKSKTSTRREKK